MGGGYDISCSNNCNSNDNSYSNLGTTYDLSADYKRRPKFQK